MTQATITISAEKLADILGILAQAFQDVSDGLIAVHNQLVDAKYGRGE